VLSKIEKVIKFLVAMPKKGNCNAADVLKSITAKNRKLNRVIFSVYEGITFSRNRLLSCFNLPGSCFLRQSTAAVENY